MRRLLTAALALALALSPATGADAISDMHADIGRVIDRGELIAAMPAFEIPAMFEGEGGELSGVEPDIARDIAESLGVSIRFDRSAQSWDDLTDMLLDGAVDIALGCYSDSLERARYVAFSKPYLEINYGLMCNSQYLVRYGMEETPMRYLRGENEGAPLRIGVEAGSAHLSVARELFPGCEIVEITGESGEASYVTAANKVKSGELFAFFNIELQFILLYTMDSSLPIYTKTFTFTDISDRYCVGLPKDSVGLMYYIDRMLDTRQAISKTRIIERFIELFGEAG